MTHIVYEVVNHGGGWAYRVGNTLSESYQYHNYARRAALDAAREHAQKGNTVGIKYEDSNGQWHETVADGSERPYATVEW
jgi:hypothetical protein